MTLVYSIVSMISLTHLSKKTMGTIQMSYYRLYLRRFLEETGNTLINDKDFITERASLAEEEYEKCRSNGMNLFASQERAMEVLQEGLSVEQ